LTYVSNPSNHQAEAEGCKSEASLDPMARLSLETEHRTGQNKKKKLDI
jgi:hypothetical protein